MTDLYSDLPSTRGVTEELNLWSQGDPAALNRAFSSLYDELQRLAQARLRSFPGCQTVEAASLLHEAYLRLGNTGKAGFLSRSDFFLLASRIMRNILVDTVRRTHALKRGRRVDITLSSFGHAGISIDIIALDTALNRLQEINPLQAKIVELKFFGALTEVQVAAELRISPGEVARSWRSSRAWLAACLGGPEISR